MRAADFFLRGQSAACRLKEKQGAIPNMSLKTVPLWAILIASISVLHAQSGTPHTPPTPAQMVARRVAQLTTLLTLTSAQQESATTLFTAEETAQQATRTSIHQAQSTLKTAVEANDAATISTTATQIGVLTGQEIATRAQTEATFYASLTADQQAKYKQLHEGGGEGFGGRGGPGHGGGPGGA
jgi:Spy/CpxP family protein refolding chaperone